jgi:hypothetical protein
LEVNLPAEAQKQQSKTIKGNPNIELFAPCRVNDGILKFTDSEIQSYLNAYALNKRTISFFIPASGSGSRMFQFLYAYLECPNEENTAMVEHFFNSMERFAFYKLLPFELRQKISSGNYDTKEVVLFILNGNGLRLGQKPKGLVPFHSMGQFVINPIQDQILQGENISFSVEQMHFTIQKEFENEIEENINSLRKFTGPGRKIGFSYQESSTDAFAFNMDGTAAVEKGELIKRPAGHGALISNLNNIREDIILIKNIDNIQHWDHHELPQRYWQLLLSVLGDVQSQVNRFLQQFDRSEFEILNKKYQLIHSEEIENWTDAQIIERLKLPMRVCGMVRNIGQPGGGPYWVKEKGMLTKQIVEKSQISTDQQSLMIKSTHFNPVMIALSTIDADGNKHNLMDYVDEEKYFVVQKEYLGKPIKYCELPGLWNGAMSKWNTVFVEVPNEIFSPVKTILDLLQPIHQPSK